MDFPELFSLAKKFKKTEREYAETAELTPRKIAVLGSSGTQLLTELLRLFLYKEGISPDIYEGEYQSTYSEAMDDGSPLYAFRPDFLILLPHHTDIKVFPPLLCGRPEADEWVRNETEFFTALWEKLAAKLPKTKILEANFAVPPERELGNLEGSAHYGKSVLLQKLNLAMADRLPSAVTLIDVEYLAQNVGKGRWFSNKDYFLSKLGCAPDCLPALAAAFVSPIRFYSGRIRKCLALDLDNTLWGGVVGDDGASGIQLSPNHPVGEAYRAFQRYVKALAARGVILAVCSKNDLDTAREPFLTNPDMILKAEDIACFVANWEDKAGNLKQIAETLNIGVDSLVFFDDNPAERAIVRQFLPQVHVVNVPEDPADYAAALSAENPFDWPELTAEDLKRGLSYAAASRQREISRKFVDYDSYLRNLDMRGESGRLQKPDAERFAQLINKSNQFNLRTIRYTDAEILELISSPDAYPITVKLRDRFADYGLISCIILRKSHDTAFIDTWVMSCRVLKRGVENFAWGAVVAAAREMGCSRINGEYLPTKKNAMVACFLPELGFAATQSDENGTNYTLDLANARVKETFIMVDS
ncbi:MAG: HAD-IIIC family phosphatase [Oscillospiraceae bacterium]|jgi:FkbH-like protein|nr:HAD-IIIC family phosphatase [Oscillospiraceae bacterium]